MWRIATVLQERTSLYRPWCVVFLRQQECFATSTRTKPCLQRSTDNPKAAARFQQRNHVTTDTIKDINNGNDNNKATQNVDETNQHPVIRMSDFTYTLHPQSIAQYPASPRGSSKLLYCNEGGHVTYYPNFSKSIIPLLQGKHVVFNESRVLDARLYVTTTPQTSHPTTTTTNNNKKNHPQQAVELMILDLGRVPLAARCESTSLSAMIRLPNVQPGKVFYETSSGTEIEIVQVIGVWQEDEKSNGNGTECLVRIRSAAKINVFFEAHGNVPIPPYFDRAAEASDAESYNNVYAASGGSVAAPTAGLHFTDAVLDEIGRNDNCSYLSLHVGAGTFKPVLVEDARQHAMHAEAFAVSVHEIRNIVRALEAGKPLVVVGTTSLRTLESLYWSGVKQLRGQDIDCNDLRIEQFEWMPLLNNGNRTSRVAALMALLQSLDGDQEIIRGATSLMITPLSYEIQMADHLVTNFHAPDSTLMLLVSAFLGSGKKVKQVYEDAQTNGYRFLSYGDSCFFSRPK